MKTCEEFLIKLIEYIDKEISTFKSLDNDWCAGHVRAFECMKTKIEQFQAEQKQNTAI